MSLLAPGGHLDGGGAVVGGVLVRGGEPGGISGVADEEGGDDGTDPVDIGDRGLRCGDGVADQGLVGFDVTIEAADVA